MKNQYKHTHTRFINVFLQETLSNLKQNKTLHFIYMIPAMYKKKKTEGNFSNFFMGGGIISISYNTIIFPMLLSLHL